MDNSTPKIDDHLVELSQPTAETDAVTPLRLGAGDCVWEIVSAVVDIFAMPASSHETSGALRHLFRLETGQAIFDVGWNHPGDGIALIARGVDDTRLRSRSRSMFE